MPPMQLFHASTSPFVRKVSVTVIETGQSAAVAQVPVAVGPGVTNDDLNAANPLGKIPALTRDDGPAIYDSRVICRYLNDRVQGALYPDARIWEVLTLEATGDAICDAAVTMVYEGRTRAPEAQSEHWTEAQWARILRTLDGLEVRWMSHLAGPLDAGQIAVGCALGYLDFRHGARNWRSGHDGLAAWFEDFAQRDSMQATAPA